MRRQWASTKCSNACVPAHEQRKNWWAIPANMHLILNKSKERLRGTLHFTSLWILCFNCEPVHRPILCTSPSKLKISHINLMWNWIRFNWFISRKTASLPQHVQISGRTYLQYKNGIFNSPLHCTYNLWIIYRELYPPNAFTYVKHGRASHTLHSFTRLHLKLKSRSCLVQVMGPS